MRTASVTATIAVSAVETLEVVDVAQLLIASVKGDQKLS